VLIHWGLELKAKEAQQLLQTTAAKAEETISIRAFNTQVRTYLI